MVTTPQAQQGANPRTTRVRQVILEAATSLLVEHGAGEVTASRIAQETGVARTTVYRYWPDQAHLLLDTIDSLVAPHAPTTFTDDLEVDLTTALTNLRARMTRKPFRQVFAALLGHANQDPKFVTAQQRFANGVLQPIHDILTSAIDRGDVSPTVNIPEACATLAGPLFHQHIMVRERIDDRLIAQTVHQFIARTGDGEPTNGAASRNPVAGLFEALRSGHAVEARFHADATVETPLRGSQHVSKWAHDEAAWLDEHDAVVHPLNHIVTDTHASAEYILSISHDGASIDLPLHLVAELESDQISALRAYHSTYPLTGEHLVRQPLVSPQPSLEPGPPVDAYEAAMIAGDPVALDALFEPDGYVREPAGATFKHQGTARMDFYGPAFSGGPVPLKLCTIIDDGATLAFEYICDRWGLAELPAQAGSAVYVRSASGLLDAVRIYDDVAPPAELFE